MARELGMNPHKFGKLANEKQEPWKTPLPEFIESLYVKRFRKNIPDRVLSIEEMAQELEQKREVRKQNKQRAEASTPPSADTAEADSSKEK